MGLHFCTWHYYVVKCSKSFSNMNNVIYHMNVLILGFIFIEISYLKKKIICGVSIIFLLSTS